MIGWLLLSTPSSAAFCPTATLTRTPFGYVAVEPDDVQAAESEGLAAFRAAKDVLDLEGARFGIVEQGCSDAAWASKDGAGYTVYPWNFVHGPRRGSSRPATDVLRHEIAHDLFVRFVAPRTREDEYGGDAPDWLDEMAAVAFESPREERDRRAAARMDADTVGLIPLPRLMEMTHPEYGHISAGKGGTSFLAKTPNSGLTIVYYSTIKAFYDFLVWRTGRRDIIADMGRAVTTGQDLRTWLPRRLGYARGPSPMERMDGEFQRWFASDPRYARSATTPRHLP